MDHNGRIMGWFAVSRIMLLLNDDASRLTMESEKAVELGKQTLKATGFVPYI